MKFPTKQQLELINLVGKKPVIKFWLNQRQCEGLWDTGSMISLMNKKVVEEKFPNLKIHSVEEFLGTGLKLAAANQTELQIEGIVLMDFGVEKSDILFQIPFIVTEEEVKEIIIGYNVIENLVVNCEKVNVHQSLSTLSNMPENKILGIINQIRAGFACPEIMGDVKIKCDQIVPANCVHRVKCKTEIKVEGPNKSVLFSPKDNWEMDNLDLMETPETLKAGKKQNICISVHNSSEKNIWLKKGTMVGWVYEISEIIPLSIKKVNENKKLNKSEDPIETRFDLKHLSGEQKQCVENLILQQSHVFSEDSDDIGHIKDFKMQIELSDKAPVSESYRKIPKLLYDEVKCHINKLLTKGWIQKSKSYMRVLWCTYKKKMED